jgi:hypothetical protein
MDSLCHEQHRDDTTLVLESQHQFAPPFVLLAVSRVVQFPAMKNPNNIRAIREELGLSQTELAKRSGTSQQQIQRLEKGERVIVKKHGGFDEWEYTVKEVRIVDGTVWLWPRSTDPAHQTPWKLDGTDNDSAGADDLSVIALVIGSFWPE